MKYYATLTTPEGEKIDLSNNMDKEGRFLSLFSDLKGDLESNAKNIDCKNTLLTSLNAPKAIEIYCPNTLLTSLNAPNATHIYCDNSPLTSLNAPNAMHIYCDNSHLKALVKDCGEKNAKYGRKR